MILQKMEIEQGIFP